MSKILKVTIEYDDKIYIAEGKEAQKWYDSDNIAVVLAYSNRKDTFVLNSIKWQVIEK